MASTFACWSSFTIESACVFEDSLAGGAGCTIEVLGEAEEDEDGEGEDGERVER
jgi:hypothetical protein